MVRESVKQLTLTPRQVCEQLKCSLATVQRFETQGLLHATRTIVDGKLRPAVTYEAREVDQLEKSWEPKRTRPLKIDNSVALLAIRGRAAQILFPLFVQAKSFPQIVVETGIDPALVRELYREWTVGGFDKGERARREKASQDQEKRDQAAYEKREDLREYRKWKKEIALIEARGREGKKP